MKTIFWMRVKLAAAVAAGVVGVGGGAWLGLHKLLAQETPKPAFGETMNLTEDLVLTADKVLEFSGAPQKPHLIIGNSHQIRTQGEWTGRLKLTYCTLKGLGKEATVENGRTAKYFHALDLTAWGDADIAIEHCTFDASSSVQVVNNGTSTTGFRNNTVLENSLARAHKNVEMGTVFFFATGKSPAKKCFQGNRIYKTGAIFDGTANWLIGGESDAESNLIIGYRAGIWAVNSTGTVIRGNYLHVLMPRNEEFPYWSQVSTIMAIGCPDSVLEHNVVRDGEWIVRFVAGEFRYNLVCDENDHDACQNGSNGRIHHNIFFIGKPDHPPGSTGGCIAVIYKPAPGGGIEIFNNTFDACGRLSSPAVEVGKEAFVKTLRNNVVYNFLELEKYTYGDAALIRTAWDEPTPKPYPERLGYADYNLFCNHPQSKSRRNYALAVVGKTERKDAGFALNDVHRGGPVDEQVDPKFTGPLADEFPFKDEDIKSGKVTVSQILAHFRKAYTPAPGSPLIDAGDPADGEGTDIGAVDAGKPAKVKGF